MADMETGKPETRLTMDENGQYAFIATEQEKEDRYDANVPIFISKSNALIKRIGKTTLLSEQALLLAIYKAKERSSESIRGTVLESYYRDLKDKSGTDFSEGLIATFTSTELKSLMNIKTSRYSSAMDDLMNMNVFTNSWHIMYVDNNGVTVDTQCVIGAKYDKRTGRVTIKFNNDIKDKILNLKNSGGYTMLDSSIMRKVSKDLATWSIYQLLREELSYHEAVNRKKGFADKKEYMTEFSLSEFKFLSTVNQVDLSSHDPEQIACQRLIKEKNYEEAEQVLPKSSRMYDDWKDFRKRVMTKACRFINGWEGTGCYGPDPEELMEYETECAVHHQTDIHFRYELVKMGHGLKVYSIRFFVRWDHQGTRMSNADSVIEIVDDNSGDVEKLHRPEKTAPVDKNVFLDQLSDLIEEKMRVSEVKSIAEASGYDLEKVRVAYMKLKKSGKDISADAVIAMMSEDTQNRPDTALYRKGLPGFSEDELAAMAQEALKHVPEGTADRDSWAVGYIAYYRDKALATADTTKTTMFNRLMDMLRKDYDGRSGSGKAGSQPNKRNVYTGRQYSEDQFDALERRKLGLDTDE